MASSQNPIYQQFQGVTYYLKPTFSPYGDAGPAGLMAAVASGTSQIVTPQQFGTIGNGEDAALITAAIDSGRGTVWLPPGDYYLEDTVLMRNKQGLKLIGSGPGQTVLRYKGDADRSAVMLLNANDCMVADFSIANESAGVPYSGLELRRTGSISGQSSFNTVHRVNVGVNNITPFTYGYYISGDIDANNDFHTFSQCRSVYAAHSSLHIDNSQSCGQHIIDPHFTFSQYGVSCGGLQLRPGDRGLFNGGSFRVNGGFIGDNTVADFFYGGPGPSVNSVVDCTSEDSARLYTTSGPAWSVHFGFNFIRQRFAHNGALNPDGWMVLDLWGSTLRIEACQFDAAQSDLTPKIYTNAFSDRFVKIEGNLWNQIGSSAAAPIVVLDGNAAHYKGGPCYNISLDGAENSVPFTVG